jgi:osmoprotectant transport system permease protein
MEMGSRCVPMGEFLASRWSDIAFRAYQHASLVAQSVAIATVIAIALAVLVTSIPRLEPVANTISTIGLTIPSFALLAF